MQFKFTGDNTTVIAVVVLVKVVSDDDQSDYKIGDLLHRLMCGKGR